MRFPLPILITLTLLLGLMANAATTPLKFRAWREQQILDAQNEVLRISAHLHQLKSAPKGERIADKDSDDFLNSSRFERSPDVTEKDLKNAQENLEAARDLGLEDYADVYVSNLKEQDPEQFSKLMDSLSKEELAQLMKILVKNKADEPSNATHNKAVISPVAATAAPHSS